MKPLKTNRSKRLFCETHRYEIFWMKTPIYAYNIILGIIDVTSHRFFLKRMFKLH